MTIPAPRRLLPKTHVEPVLHSTRGFHLDERGHVRCRWRFPDFAGAFAFAGEIAKLAEQRNHHPDITVGWGHLELDLYTHDRGGITQKDLDLVTAIEALGRSAEPRPAE